MLHRTDPSITFKKQCWVSDNKQQKLQKAKRGRGALIRMLIVMSLDSHNVVRGKRALRSNPVAV